MKALHAGELCLMLDAKDRRYLLELKEGGRFSSHHGVIPHEDLIGLDDGSTVQAPNGSSFTVLRPRMTDYVLKMRRGPQVVYPKDMGPIIVHGDIGPGMTVVEAGTGSGALTIALLRAVGPTGRVVSVDRRDDHARHGREAIARWSGGIPDGLDLRVADVEDVVAEVNPERLVLDLPEPWHALRVGADALPGGAVVVAYVPTTIQLQETVLAMRETGAYTDIDAFETMERSWHVGTRSVRPAHQMVGHTGFLIVARKIEPVSAEQRATSHERRAMGNAGAAQ